MPDYIPARYHSLANVINPNIPALAARGFLSTLGDVQMPGAMREPTPLNLQQALAQDPNILLARRQQEQARAQEFGAKAEQAGVEAYEATFKQLGTQFKTIGTVLTAVDTPEEWDVVREMLDKTDPTIRKLMSLPDAFDPVAIDQGRKMALSAPEYFNTRAKAQQAAAENPKFGFVLDLTAIPEDATDEEKAAHWQGVVDLWRAQGADPALVRQFEVYTPQGYTFAKRLAQVGQQAVTKPSAADKPPTVGSFEDYVVRFAREKGVPPEQLGPADIELARKKYQQADDRPPRVTVNVPTGAGSDAGEIAEAIIRGDQPPVTTGLYRMGGPVRAALARKGFDLSTAQRDWNGTIKAVQQLNGAQQVRMRQAISKTYHSLDLVDDLVEQWQGGRFPALNKARILAAKQGLLGPQAQKIATLLDQQINDVVGEMANVLMGGNSPTDRGLELASHNMKAEWSQATLTAAVEQARRNLKLAQQAMVETVPAGTSPDNRYWQGAGAPATSEPAASPTKRKRYNPKTKRIEEY